MKKLLLILLCFFTFTSCEKEEILPSIEMSLDGQSFDPYERYAQIKTFAGRKYENNIVKKYLFFIYKLMMKDQDWIGNTLLYIV